MYLYGGLCSAYDYMWAPDWKSKEIYLQHPAQYDNRSVTDAKRLIKKTPVTKDEEVAKKAAYELNINAIEEEARYDGFYAVCTNLDDNPAQIARINHDRWEIKVSRDQGRNYITRIVEKIHNAVKSEKPWVKMSCSVSSIRSW